MLHVCLHFFGIHDVPLPMPYYFHCLLSHTVNTVTCLDVPSADYNLSFPFSVIATLAMLRFIWVHACDSVVGHCLGQF